MRTVNNEIYNHIPATWWEEDGFMAILRTAINPPRFAYFQRLLQGREPQGLRVLDVGCGGGYLAEQFARLGCTVTGVDRSAPTLAAARAHAAAEGLSITYREASGETLPFADQEFDVVCCCDVLEHVDSVDAVIGEIARVLKPQGLFFFDTINRTLKSKLVAIKMAQDWPVTRFMPRDVHVWEKFIRPAELSTQLRRHGLGEHALTGLAPQRHPLRMALPLLRQKLGRISFAELGEAMRMGESRDLSISYMGYARRDANA